VPGNKSEEMMGKMAITLFPRESDLGFLVRMPEILVILEKSILRKLQMEQSDWSKYGNIRT
jgi:hypothetical protein